jgi:hypothetical protein
MRAQSGRERSRAKTRARNNVLERAMTKQLLVQRKSLAAGAARAAQGKGRPTRGTTGGEGRVSSSSAGPPPGSGATQRALARTGRRALTVAVGPEAALPGGAEAAAAAAGGTEAFLRQAVARLLALHSEDVGGGRVHLSSTLERVMESAWVRAPSEPTLAEARAAMRELAEALFGEGDVGGG